VRVGLTDEIDAGGALALVDLLDREEVHRALRIALKVPPEAWALFDRLFDEHWDGAPASKSTLSHHRALREQRGAAQWKWDGKKVTLEIEEAQDGDTPSYSPEAMLRRKPFEDLTAGELAAMERLIARLAPRLATRRSRRLVPTHGRGQVDLRRSFRRAIGGSDLLRLARRARKVEEPKLILLFDTSGSMDSHARLFLAFAFALRRVVKRVDVFAFNTSLVRVTRMIAPVDIARTLGRLAAGVPDWSGGTRIGACLAEFVGQYDQTLVDRHTAVVIVSDGLDHGDAALLQKSMRRLRERAGKIIWLNPLLGDARYRPETEGMRAALPFVDRFAPAHNLEALEQLILLVD
jgi:uncharacterized protein